MFTFLYDMFFSRQSLQPSDLFETVIDFSKDGAGEICIYEVQSCLTSGLFSISYNGDFLSNAEALYANFFNGLFLGRPYFAFLPLINSSVSNAPQHEFELREPHVLHKGKIVQRLYFNLHPVLQATMPNVAMLTVDDVHNDACMSKLFEIFKSKKIIIKQSEAAGGEGNIFVDDFASIAKLKRILIKAFQALPEDQAFLLVEEQLQAYQEPEKDHRDVYRCACVLSHDFFNAQIITHYKIASNAANSHDFTQRTYFLTKPPITTYRHEGESESVPDERVVPKAARNLDLANEKPRLFDRLKEITQALAMFDRQAFDAYPASEDNNTLTFGKVHFLSIATRNQVVKQAQSAAQQAKSRPPRP